MTDLPDDEVARNRSATSGSPRVSVIVPTRDRPLSLAGCLAALEAQTAPDFEVVVVDDASVEGDAVAQVVAGAPRARLVRGAGRGPAAARNLGAVEARGAVLCFTDDDCRPTPGWIEAVTRGVDDVTAVVGLTRNARPDDVYATASQAITNHLVTASLHRGTGRVSFGPTSNLACTAARFRTLRFDEEFPLAAGEDRDWCARLVESGGALVHVPAAEVLHRQELGWRGFWRQQHRYGQGAHAFHRSGRAGTGPQAPGFYLGLVRAGFREGVAPGALVILAQVATATGVLRAALAARG